MLFPWTVVFAPPVTVRRLSCQTIVTVAILCQEKSDEEVTVALHVKKFATPIDVPSKPVEPQLLTVLFEI